MPRMNPRVEQERINIGIKGIKEITAKSTLLPLVKLKSNPQVLKR
jgi:hypothetical protein